MFNWTEKLVIGTSDEGSMGDGCRWLRPEHRRRGKAKSAPVVKGKVQEGESVLPPLALPSRKGCDVATPLSNMAIYRAAAKISSALSGFPTAKFGEWQWIDLTGEAHMLNLNTLPEAREPIMQPIDDYNRSWKLGMLYECAVGTGKRTVLAFDLDSNRTGSPPLKHSILTYMDSNAFKPGVAVSMGNIKATYDSRAARPSMTRQRPKRPQTLTAPEQSTTGKTRTNFMVQAAEVAASPGRSWRSYTVTSRVELADSFIAYLQIQSQIGKNEDTFTPPF